MERDTPKNEEVPKLDLTLRLGPPIQNDNENQVNGNASNMERLPSNFVYSVDFVNQQLAAQGIRNNNNNNVRECRQCGAKTTPLWRKGPLGRQTLCNACGLRYLRAEKRKNAGHDAEADGDAGGSHVVT